MIRSLVWRIGEDTQRCEALLDGWELRQPGGEWSGDEGVFGGERGRVSLQATVRELCPASGWDL